jgi:ribonuclease HI
MKINIDASFVDATGEAGVGVVIRNHKVLLMSWRVLFRCASADEAEGQACAEGLWLASHWCPGPTILESDSARLVTALGDAKEDRSELRWSSLEAKEFLQLLPEWKIKKVKWDYIVMVLLMNLLI